MINDIMKLYKDMKFGCTHEVVQKDSRMTVFNDIHVGVKKY